MKNLNLYFGFFIVCLTASAALAQTTAFTYQGRLSDAGVPPTATYQMEFKLFGSADGTDQIGATFSNPSVPVAAGNFTVQLDFGAAAFDGTDRFLQIAVRRNAGDEFTVLAPRQKINSAPYAVKSKSAEEANNAAQLGGVAAAEYVTTSSADGSFIKNATTPQTDANFNVDGNGVVGGTLGVGAAPLPDVKFDVSGRVRFNAGGSGGVFQFGSSSFETGMTIAGTNRADYRFDGSTLKLLAGAGVGPPPTTNGININTAGNVGIGTNIPSVKLEVNGVTRFTPGGSGGRLEFGTPSAETGMTIVGTNRADYRFDGSTLKLIAGLGTGAPPTTNGININTAGNVGIGTTAPTAALHVVGTTRASVLEITGGSDLAEKFEFSETVKPGMVVAIDARNAGKLTIARGAYNRQVAGIISGANDLAAGMLLPDLKETTNAMPVALSGRVWVYADATENPIVPGDLLTTSDTPGHAMKVTKHKKAQGAIIGKAMTALESGKGLVLVLVTLQ